MFGHNDNQQLDQNQDNSQASMTPAEPSVPGFSQPPAEPMPAAVLDETAEQTMSDNTGPSGLPGNLTPPAPLQDASAAPGPATSAPATTTSDAPLATDELVSIKQEALQHLSPLVDHLDQSPEERFRTTMMMIQATDDSSKIKDAYEAAQQIQDEKVRAQALLDVVNEINYFTHQSKQK